MIENGRNNGYRKSFQLQPAQPSSAIGQLNKTNLDSLAQYQVLGDKVFCVTAFRLVLPPIRVTAPAFADPQNFIDAFGVLANLQANVFAGSESPFGVLGEGGGILNTADFRGFEALSHVSGALIVENFNRDEVITTIKAAGVEVATFQSYRSNGWLSRGKPLARTVAAGGDNDMVVVLNLPVGQRAGEAGGLMPIPAAYFTGTGCFSNCKGQPGYIDWRWLSNTIQNASFVQLAGVYALYVDGVYVPRDSIPMPPKLTIQQTGYSGTRQAMPIMPGAIAYAAMRSDMVAGNETVVLAGRVDMRCAGEQVCGDIREIRAFELDRNERRPGWNPSQLGPVTADNAPLGLTRFVDPGTDALVLAGTHSLRDMPGSDSVPTTVTMTEAATGTGAQLNSLVTAVYRPRTTASDDAHKRLYDIPGTMIVVPATIGGGAVLPAKQVSVTPINAADIPLNRGV